MRGVHKFTLELLRNFCNEHELNLVSEYQETDKISRATNVQTMCKYGNCTNVVSKTFRFLYDTLNFGCDIHCRVLSEAME